MEEIIFIIKTLRLILALIVAFVAWIALNIFLTIFIDNEYIILAFSTILIGVMLYSYFKELAEWHIE